MHAGVQVQVAAPRRRRRRQSPPSSSGRRYVGPIFTDIHAYLGTTYAFTGTSGRSSATCQWARLGSSWSAGPALPPHAPPQRPAPVREHHRAPAVALQGRWGTFPIRVVPPCSLCGAEWHDQFAGIEGRRRDPGGGHRSREGLALESAGRGCTRLRPEDQLEGGNPATFSILVSK